MAGSPMDDGSSEVIWTPPALGSTRSTQPAAVKHLEKLLSLHVNLPVTGEENACCIAMSHQR